jgi:hypothetical protein
MNETTKIPSQAVYHTDLEQGTDAWLEARLGILTASEMKNLFTKALAPAGGEMPVTHLYKMAAERITRHIEPHFMSYAMERGHEDEVSAIEVYSKNVAPVKSCGFITNSKWGFTLGYSPDGLVGDDGLIECKSRDPHFQIRTIFESVINGDTAPAEFMLQLQTGLMISERKWIDFISYSEGLPMPVVRVFPDDVLQQSILEVAQAFEAKLVALLKKYEAASSTGARLYPTERPVVLEI